ncbi:tetratricopeptide repeat protein [Aliivibrio fischeri]|nr:tetratricopeptide repeat protein [Aliivibrio fischeri]
MLGYFHFIIGCFFFLISFNSSATSVMSSESWQEEYHLNRIENPNKALSMLNNVYSSLPPSAERIFTATRIHGFVTRRGNEYTSPLKNNTTNIYDHIESLILLSMDLEDNGDYKQALQQIRKAQLKSKNLNDLDLNSLLSIKQCRSNLALGNYYLAEFYCQSAIKHLEKTKDHYIDIKWAYRLLALSYQGVSDFKSALKANEKALSLSKSYELNDTIYNNISSLLLQMGQLKEAEKYAKKALKIREKRQISQKIAQSHILLAQIYLKSSQYVHAKSCANFAIAQLNDNTTNAQTLSQAYLTLAAVLNKQSYYDEAIEYLLLALKQLDNHSNSDLLINTYQLLSSAYLKHENSNKALDYISIAIDKSQQSQNQQALANSYLIKSDIEEFTGDIKAALITRKLYENVIKKIHALNDDNRDITLELRNLLIEKEKEKLQHLKEKHQQLSAINTEKQHKLLFQIMIIILVLIVYLVLRLKLNPKHNFN